MPFVKSLPQNAGPPEIFRQYPEIYKAWAELSQELMRGKSELTPGERELILAFAAGTAGCEFVHGAHSEVAYAWGIAPELLESLLIDPSFSAAEPRLRPLLAFVRKLTLTHTKMNQADADAVFAAGWSEKTFHDIVAITARMRFMQCLAEGYGFVPFSKDFAKLHAAQRVKLGYVNLYPELAGSGKTSRDA